MTLFGSNWLTGLVVWWPFAIVDIPNGWALCDGDDGRPDYRNYMLIGAGDLYTPGQVLGSLVHNHFVNMPEAVVQINGSTSEEDPCLEEGVDIDYAYEDPYFDACTEPHYHEVSIEGEGHDHDCWTEDTSELPPCKAGCWIIKL